MKVSPIPKCGGFYGTPERIPADVHVLFFVDDDALFRKTCERLVPLHKRTILDLRTKGDFCGKTDEVLPLIGNEERYILAGLGAPEEISRDVFLKAAGRAMREAQRFVAQTVSVYLPFTDAFKKHHIPFDEIVETAVQGVLLGSYKYDKYMTRDPENKKARVKNLQFVTGEEGFQSTLKHAIDHAVVIMEGVEMARNLVNAPANEVNAEALAKEAQTLATKYKLEALILKRKEMTGMKMAGLLAVSRGSSDEPRFIILEYNKSKHRAPLFVLVGKGVTFDSGGLSIKPATAMEEMKMDMAGAAAVLGTMYVVAKLKLPIRLVALIPATDNKTGPDALCPGDIITYGNGKTVEVLNTDAEGRLILADALLYAQRYKPDGIIDLATLTGACVVALASHAAGMMGTSDILKKQLFEAGERTAERVWELPLFPEYDKMLKSTVADLKNIGGRWGGAITAAAFLKAFAGDSPWVHLDIAGTAILDEATDVAPKGGSGFGVRLLVEFLRHQAL